MEDLCLTNDEKRCLQMWFRQAIVEAEKQEALRSLMAQNKEGGVKSTHPSISVRRSRRGRIMRQLVK